jgi:O-antigen/teichoic acid export membrane protein
VIKALRKRFSRTSLVTAGSIGLFAATTLVNLGSFAFHLVVSRQLTPEEYGALGALVGLLFVFTVPSAALQIAITREVAMRHVSDDDEPLPIVAGPLLASSVVWGVLTTVVLLAAAPALDSFLHLPSLTSSVLLALYLLPITIELVPKAVLLGQMRFGMVAISLVVGAIIRLALAYPMTDSRGVDGAMAATVLGALITPVILLFALRKLVHPREGVEPLRIRWRDGTGAIAAFAGYWTLVTIDTVMARHELPRAGSGLYAAASLAARSVMFLPSAIATIAFPSFAAANGRGLSARRALVQSAAVVAGMGLAAALVLIIFPDLVVGTLFPEEYEGLTGALGILAVSAAAMGTTSLLMHFHLAMGSRIGAGIPWVGVVLIAVGVSMFHESVEQVAWVTLGSNLVTLAMMSWPIFVSSQKDDVEFLGRDLWELSAPDRDLTLVVPHYNPGELLHVNIGRIVDVLDSAGTSFEIIAVSDGSTDNSDAALSVYGDRVKIVRLPVNRGKGQALRTGLAMGRGRYVGFIDADGDIDPASLTQFLALVRLYEPDIILGSKRHPMSDLRYPPIRRVYSWGYQQLVRILFRLNLRDTQTGLKLIRREVLAQVLPRLVEKRFAFDLEMFVVARHLGFQRNFEAPVQIHHQFTSTISIRSVRGTLLDTLAIFYRLHVLRYYDEPSRPIARAGGGVGTDAPAAQTLTDPTSEHPSPAGKHS